jgi:hypothetical protein
VSAGSPESFEQPVTARTAIAKGAREMAKKRRRFILVPFG